MVKKYNDYLEDQAAKEEHNFAGSAIQQDTLEALQNVVEAMTRDREDVATLSQANAASEARTETVETQLKLVLKHIAVLTSRVDKLERSSAPATPSPRIKNKKYCYTCGVQRDHGSIFCKVGAPGHKRRLRGRIGKGGIRRIKQRHDRRQRVLKIKLIIIYLFHPHFFQNM